MLSAQILAAQDTRQVAQFQTVGNKEMITEI
jgi:hypothetical protein